MEKRFNGYLSIKGKTESEWHQKHCHDHAHCITMLATLSIKTENHIGGDGIWYKDTGGQDLMLKTHGWEQSGKSWMPIAWDVKASWKTAPTKGFGYHEGIDAVHDALMQTPLSNRNGYEIIAKNTPCLPYLDIEFLVPNDGGRNHLTDPDHRKLVMILGAVRENFKAAYGIDVSFTALIGSRKKDAVCFKYSYHFGTKSRNSKKDY